MPITYRPYEVACSRDIPADGPPFLAARILPSGQSYDLFELFLRWKPEIDRASDDQILVTIIGDNEQSGTRYKELRTEALARRDAAAAKIYRRRLRSQEGTRAAEIHVNTEETIAAARLLNVDLDCLPCIVWSTWPDLHPPLRVPIKPSWHASEQASRHFLETFVRWLTERKYASVFRDPVAVGDARKKLLPLLRALERRIDRAVGEKTGAGKRKSRTASKRVTLRIEGITDKPATPTRCARLVVTQGGRRDACFIGIRQLFFLTAFGDTRERRLIDGISYFVLPLTDLGLRLKDWHKRGIRPLSQTGHNKPYQRIQRDWPQFVDQMRKISELEDVVAKPRRDLDDEQVYYVFRCQNIRLINTIGAQDLERLFVHRPNPIHRQ